MKHFYIFDVVVVMFGVLTLFSCSVVARESKGIFSLNSRAFCLSSDQRTSGTCLSRPECTQQGGKVIGYCGVFSTCCSLQTCEIVTRAKDATFSNPTNIGDSGQECSYSVEINNPRVCQIRVDFEIFSLSQPRLKRKERRRPEHHQQHDNSPQDVVGVQEVGTPPVNAATSTDRQDDDDFDDDYYEGYQRKKRESLRPKDEEKKEERHAFACRDDVFELTSLQAHSEIIPPLCGENSGQHLYIRVNSTINTRAVRMVFKTVARGDRQDLGRATWRIRVRQLECYNTRGLHKKPSLLSVLTSNYPVKPEDLDPNLFAKTSAREGKDDVTGVDRVGRDSSTASRDEYIIAPPGCLQYYPDRAGTFESFNFNRGLGPYTGNLKYAICFRRSVDVCGIKFSPAIFRLAAVKKRKSRALSPNSSSSLSMVGQKDRNDERDKNERERKEREEREQREREERERKERERREREERERREREERERREREERERERDENEGDEDAVDGECDGPSHREDDDGSHDFLFISDGETADGLRGSKWCGTSAQGLIVASSPPGPLFVFFNSDHHAPSPKKEVGFRINYNVLNNC